MSKQETFVNAGGHEVITQSDYHKSRLRGLGYTLQRDEPEAPAQPDATTDTPQPNPAAPTLPPSAPGSPVPGAGESSKRGK